MNKRTLAAGVTAAAVLLPAATASAHHCSNASKPTTAGSIDLRTVNFETFAHDKIKFTKSGRFVIKAGFLHDGTGSQFAHANAQNSLENASPNKPGDRGVVESTLDWSQYPE